MSHRDDRDIDTFVERSLLFEKSPHEIFEKVGHEARNDRLHLEINQHPEA